MTPGRATGIIRECKIDAFLSSPQGPSVRHNGYVIVNTSASLRSQYFWRMLGGNPEFVRKHPVTMKRILFAVMRASANAKF
jgi:ABC-type nitrate/sulfonate/bicarbonate transport system substrate-binding protein